MRRLLVLPLLVIPVRTGTESPVPGPPAVAPRCAPAVTLFQDVDVHTMGARGLLRGRSVLVRNGRIERVARSGSIPTPHGARIVEGRGRTLIPGLSDTHVHLDLDAEGWMGLFLANGVTTVFNQRGGPEHLRLRARIGRCEVDGPTVYTAGPFTNEPRVRSAADARRAVREQKAAGYDFLKLHGDLTAEAYTALIREGRERRLPVTGHAPRNLTFDAVLDHRQALIAHAEELIYTHFTALDTTRIPALAARMAEAGSWLIPTLSTFANIVEQWGDPSGLDAGLAAAERPYLTPAMEGYWRERNPYLGRDPSRRGRIRAMHAFQEVLVRALHESGVPLLAGTDTPLPVMYPGFSLHEELAALRRTGIGGEQVLRIATANAGTFVREHMDQGARFGRVEEGYRADLLLVDGDPARDLRVLSHPHGVMVRGRWYDRQALDELLAEAVRAGRGR